MRKASEQRIEDNEAFARQFAVHVGVDCGKYAHKLVPRGPDGRRLKAINVPVSREGFDATDAALQRLFPGISAARRSSVSSSAGTTALPSPTTSTGAGTRS